MPRVTFQNGQTQETCRDLNHTSMGLAGTINAAETASLQGDDLYGEQQARITTAVSYATGISLGYRETSEWPTSFCGGTDELSQNVQLASLPVDVVYNAYAVRESEEFPDVRIPGYAVGGSQASVEEFINESLASDATVRNTTAWEGLTHHHLAGLEDPGTPASPSPEPPSTPTAAPTPPRGAEAQVGAPRSADLPPHEARVIILAMIVGVPIAALLLVSIASLVRRSRLRRR
ncbi:hypothetical protein [Microbacterium indicum]|uniref:hypothetical protein n=1 Tax=Microbacterium indicum TaxID=358100 RepID=UPI000491B5B7|nr:hypothetical protein [Microbacterium indicum]